MLSLIAKANQGQIAQFILIILPCRKKNVIEPMVKKKLTIVLSVMVSFCCFAMEIMLNPYRYGTTIDAKLSHQRITMCQFLIGMVRQLYLTHFFISIIPKK